MQLDSYTILVATCAVLVLLSLQFLYFFLRDRNATWLAWMAAPYFSAGVALVLFAQRGFMSDIATIGLSNGFLFLAFGFAWQGVRVFDGRRPILWPILLPPVAWCLLCSQPFFIERLDLRIIGASLIMGGYGALAASELWRNRAERLASRRAIIWVFASYSTFMALRIPLVGILPFPFGSQLPIAGSWIGLFAGIVLTHVAAISVLMIAMTKERRELRQREFARLDPLTGLANRRAFIEEAGAMLHEMEASGRSLGVLIIDLDHFKHINDRFGHSTGDRVLVNFSKMLRVCLRPGDPLFRIGGEEFCVLLPTATATGAHRVAERICEAIRSTHLATVRERIATTVSIGVASTDYTGYTLDTIMDEADAALYEAKATGRDRAVLGGGMSYAPTVRITRHYAA